jgi:hypothetical protein
MLLCFIDVAPPRGKIRPMKSVIVLFAAVGLLACHNEPDPLTPNQFFQQRAQAVCSALETACWLSVPTCTAARINEYQLEYQAALAAYRDFIPSNAQTCVDKVSEVYGKLKNGMVAMPASDYQAMQATCANVYRGASPANGACLVDQDCLGSSLICDKGFCGTGSMKEIGAGCGNIGETCVPGAYCAPNPITGFAVCTAKAGLQADCTATPCLETLRCAAGFCQARLTLGGACTSDGDCGTGLFCEPYAHQCSGDIRFAPGTDACKAMGGS